MAIEYGFTGFEGGEADACPVGLQRGQVVGSLRARTGQCLFEFYTGVAAANSWYAYRRRNTTLGTGLGTGASATTITRVFFKLIAFPLATNAPCFGVGSNSVGANQRTALAIDTTGHFAAQTPSGTGVYSAATLTLDAWYRIDLTHVATQLAGANMSLTVTISVYDANDTLVETVTRTQSPIATNVSLPTDVVCGNPSVTAFVCMYEYDDWWWGSADGADQATLAFPTATRITRVPATAQGAAADWTGDYRTIIDAPRETIVTDEQSCAATVGLTTTFTHATAGALNISGIEGILVRGQLRTPSGGAGNEALLYNGVQYTVAVPSGAAFNTNAQEGVSYPDIGSGFDSAEFGARNLRGVASGLRLATCYLEVLHSGLGVPTPFINGSGPWRLNMITYTGNGAYQTITGMGFGASVLMIFPVTGLASTGGVLKLARAGGTTAFNWGGGTRNNNGVPSITGDGFTLGPNDDVNQSGQTFLAIGIQDGTTGALSSDMYAGSQVDGRDYVMPTPPTPFQPDIVLVADETAAVLRTSAMVGDISLIIGQGNPNIANQIQALNTDGFELGDSTFANGVIRSYFWWAQQIIPELASFVHVGTITPGGASFTATGIPFTPVFVLARQQASTNQTYWRSSLTHVGADSTQLGSANNSITAITSLTADGFTGGAAISSAGVPVFWVAFAPGTPAPPPCIGIAAPRTDGLPYSPTTGPVCAGDGIVDGPRTGV